MKVIIEQDEWYPVYMYREPSPSEIRPKLVEVPSEVIEEYDRAAAAFDEAGTRLAAYF